MPSLFSNRLDTIDLTVYLQVVPSDDLATKVQFVLKLLVKHRQYPVVELSHIAFNLLLSGCRCQAELFAQVHGPDTFCHRADSLVKIGEKLVQFRLICSHVHPV